MSEATRLVAVQEAEQSRSAKAYTAKAYAAGSATSPLAPASIQRRAPKPEDVQIEILFCGICHSDLHQARNEWSGFMPTIYPCVPGHEIVGRVTKVGSAVTKYKAGDLAAVGCMVDSDRTCPECQAGLEQFCLNPTFTYNFPDKHLGGVTYGGYSDSIVVVQRSVLHVPSNLKLAGAAPLLCAGITTYSPMRHWGVTKGKKVGVVGLGGLGHMGVRFAHALGAHVVVFTTSPNKKEDALCLGADEVVISKNADEMQKHAGSFDFILDAVSADHDINAYINLLRRDGNITLVGAPEKPLAVSAFGLIMGRRVRKTIGSTITEFIYDLAGNVATERQSTNGGTSWMWTKGYVYFVGQMLLQYDGVLGAQGAATYFAHKDHLGSSRLLTKPDKSYLPQDVYDYLPFGEQLSSGGSTTHRFTGKERDTESGLDYFGARYYSNTAGRFMTIDPIVMSRERMVDPQQLNAHAYTRGNPLRFVDPNGEEVRLADLTEEERRKLIAQLQKQTGLTLQYNGKTGNLEVVGDPSKATGGSATFRKGLLAAIGSKDVFNVLDKTEHEGRAVDMGLYDPRTKTVLLNFSNIDRVEQNRPDDVNLGTTFYHELVGHGVEDLPDTREFRFWLPTALGRENEVRSELGMYIRYSWRPSRCKKGTRTIVLYKNLNSGMTDWHFVDIPVVDKKKP